MEDPKDWEPIIRTAMGYTDAHGMARAATLMQAAVSDLWKKCASQAKREFGKEMEAAVAELRHAWNPTIEPSNAAVRDVIAKTLQAHGYYPYPELVSEILGHNPYQIRGVIPSYTGDQDAPKVEAKAT